MPQVPSPILPTPDPAETGPAGLNPRQSAIVERARAEGFVAVEALTAAFDVTPQTIRRDIKLLCDLGILRRYYGGASLVTNTHNMEYETRRNLMAAEKAAIGRLVAEHIPDGASLFLNVGTTTEAVARALLGHRGLKVITNNINLAILLSQGQDFEVSIAGGRIRPDDLAVVGEATVDFINNFRVDFGIIGISGIDFDGTLLDFDFREVKVAQTDHRQCPHRVPGHRPFQVRPPRHGQARPRLNARRRVRRPRAAAADGRPARTRAGLRPRRFSRPRLTPLRTPTAPRPPAFPPAGATAASVAARTR